MFRSTIKIAFRNLSRNKIHSFINIAGLSVGMAVAMLIGLWIWDELSFDRFPDHYDRVARVMQNRVFNGDIKTASQVPVPLAAELKKSYGEDFRYTVLASWNWTHILSAGEKNMSWTGSFMGPDAPDMFSLNMLKGSRAGLADPSSIFLSQSVASALFGDTDPLDKMIRIDNDKSLKVAGIYQDFPDNSTLHDVQFIGPWDYFTAKELSPRTLTDWNDNSFGIYVEIVDKADMAAVSARIKDARLKNVGKESAKYQPGLFLQPIADRHLYSEFKNGHSVGGRIQYVWLFGIIGLFVLLLACINFMNLSTARSERRAKEVGIRKAIGSLRRQLILQFFSESLLVAAIAFALALGLVLLMLPFFNELAGKKIIVLWTNPLFWSLSIGFALFTGIIAGSYPALYLSSFRPVKVLKGVFRAGRFAAVPRKVLVVLQFTVSVILIIGTIIVFKQIQYARNRPVGYSRDGLVTVEMTTDDLFTHFDAVQSDLLRSGAVSSVALSNSSTTGVNYTTGNIDWKGKDPGMTVDFANIGVTSGYGKTVGWQIRAGRDFSSAYLTDSSAVILNETAIQIMGLKNPVGETIRRGTTELHVIGVIDDMVMESPYEPVKQTLFYIRKKYTNDYLNIRIDPNTSVSRALPLIADICKTYSPSAPFEYKFVDEAYARKFFDEERIGRLAGFFAILAVFISCLGLFGMATFMAEQRVKEIGVRKVLGASVFSLWRLLSREFVVLVALSMLIAFPLAHYFMANWLQHYQYRSDMPWWIFAIAGVGALVITILTVSYQSIKAALMNPVKSLRSE
jgi:putative ABC transport system permease protein